MKSTGEKTAVLRLREGSEFGPDFRSWTGKKKKGLFQDFCEVDYAGIRVDSLATIVGQPRRRRFFFGQGP